MEKDSAPNSRRREILSRATRALIANASAPPHLAPRGAEGQPRKVKARDPKAEAKPKAKLEPKAKRQRQRVESRAEMLERLSNPLISLHEASVLLGVCSATVRRISNEGELPHERTEGGQRRFYLRDVLQVLEARDKRRDASGRASSRPARSSGGRFPSISPRPCTPSSPSSPPSASARARSAQELLAATRARAQAAQQQASHGRPPSPSAASDAPASARAQPQPSRPGEALRPRLPLPLRLGGLRPRVPGAAPIPAAEPSDSGLGEEGDARDSESARGRG